MTVGKGNLLVTRHSLLTASRRLAKLHNIISAGNGQKLSNCFDYSEICTNFAQNNKK